MQNPDQGLEALARPPALTLGQMALLDLVESPLVLGDYASLHKTVFALWLLSMPTPEAAAAARDPDGAIRWADALTPAEYRRRLGEALAGIEAFYRMLPRAEEGAKKNGSATDSSPNSPSGSAAPTDGGSTTS